MATKKPFTLRLRPDTQELLDSLAIPNTGFIQAALDLIDEHDLIQYVQMKYAGMAVPRLGTASAHAPVPNPFINFTPAAMPVAAPARDVAPAPILVSAPMFDPPTRVMQMNSKTHPKISPEKRAYLDSYACQPKKPKGSPKLWFPKDLLAADLKLTQESVDAWVLTLDPFEVMDVDGVPCVSSLAIAFCLDSLTQFGGEFMAWAQTHCEEA